MIFGEKCVKNSKINFKLYHEAAEKLLKKRYKFPWRENKKLPEVKFRKIIDSYGDPSITFYFYDQLRKMDITILEVCYDHRYDYKPYYITPSWSYMDHFWSVF